MLLIVHKDVCSVFGAEERWMDIWWSVGSGAGPASASQCCVSGDESQAPGVITCCLLTSARASESGAGDTSGSPHLSRALLLKARPSLLAPGPYFLFVPGCVAALCGSTHISSKYVSILPLPLAEVTSSAWPSWPRHSAPIIFPLANLSVLISIILPCLLRALTALTVSLSK